MTSVQNVTAPTVSPGLGASGGTPTTAAAIKDQFMTMLVAQMKYQDPTAPMDSSQMTNQLAQISTVDGVQNLNTTMSSLLSAIQSGQSYQASSLIGHSISTPSNSLTLANGKASFAIQLPSSADTIKVNVLNPAGQVVDTINLGGHASGTFTASWNGQDSSGKTLADGAYTFKVAASSAGAAINTVGMTYANVLSVSTGANGPMLNLDNNTSVAASSVAQIL